MLQHPAAIIPFGKADPKLDPKDTSFVALNSADAANEAKCMSTSLETGSKIR